MLELAAAGDANGELVDLGTGSGVLAIAAAKLGWGPIRGYDHEQAAIEAAAVNAHANGVELNLERTNLREQLPDLAPTVVANMTAPILSEISRQLDDDGHRGRARRSLHAVAPASPPPVPTTMVLSGLLPTELDEISAAFAPTGLVEHERRRDGDWAALLLKR